MFNREKYIEFKKDLQLKYPFLNIVSNNIGSFIDGDKGIFFIESSKSLSEEEKNRVMLELIKLKNEKRISQDRYYEETGELWKK